VPAGVSTNGLLLETTLDAATDLLGTPFVAGDNTPDSHDPTAVTLSTFNTSLASLPNWLLIAVFVLLAGLTITVILLKRKQLP
jgi:hypothetical protein